MSWRVQHEGLWIPWSSPLASDGHKFFYKCILVAEGPIEPEGFVVIQPRAYQIEFIQKILARFANKKDIRLKLYLPEFLGQRHEKFKDKISSLNVEVIFTPYLYIQNAQEKQILTHKLKVVNVDDSPVILKLLKHVLAKNWVDVLGQSSDSMQAVDLITKLNPDIVTLDIQMPKKNGVQVLRELLAVKSVPVIMVSSLNLEEGSLVFDALNAGAFDYLQKPQSHDHKEFQEELLKLLVAAKEGADMKKRIGIPLLPKTTSSKRQDQIVQYPKNLIWTFGSSTGGTQALTQVFSSLPANIPPTLIVQHIPPVFSKAFADSLNALCPFTVQEATDGDVLEANHAYIAPGGKQMRLEKVSDRFLIRVTDDAPVNRFKPSVDYLFHSLSEFVNLHIVAGIFTGMGKDGAAGLLALRNAGHETFAQDEASSVVFGMPRAAIELGAARHVFSLDEMARRLVSLSIKPAKAA